MNNSSKTNLSPSTIAVITAAVTIATGKRVHIKRIRYRHAAPDTTWSKFGRFLAVMPFKGKGKS